MSAPGRQCQRHAGVPAGWECADCQAALCPDCTATRHAGTTPYEICCLCGGHAHRLRRLRREVGFAARLPGAFTFMFTRSGLTATVAAGLFIYFFGLAGSRGAAIGQALLWAYVFSLIRATSRGSREIEPPSITTLDDLVRPALAGAFATAIVWGPALLYVLALRPSLYPERPGPDPYEEARLQMVEDLRRQGLEQFAPPPRDEAVVPDGPHEDEFDPGSDEPPGAEAAPEARPAPKAAPPAWKEPPPLWMDPVVWLLLLFGILYAPMALTFAAVGSTLLDVLNPLRVGRAILHVPRDYLVLVLFALGLVLLDGVLRYLGALIDRIPVPLVPGWIAGILATYSPLVAGRAFGLLLYVRGAELGYLPPDDAWESLGEPVPPRGSLPAPAAPDGAGAAPMAEAAPGQPAFQRSFEPIALEEPPQAAPVPVPAAPSLAEALQRAIAAKDAAQVVALYRDAREALPAELHFDAGRAAAASGEDRLALQAFKAVVTLSPDCPAAPKALVMMGRIYAERLGDPATAARVYQHLVQRYPGTEAAAFAQQRLPPAT